MICTECDNERGDLSHYAHEGAVCWPCYVKINLEATPPGTGIEGPGQDGAATPGNTFPGFSHALGCQFNTIPALACVCGLPNKPQA